MLLKWYELLGYLISLVLIFFFAFFSISNSNYPALVISIVALGWLIASFVGDCFTQYWKYQAYLLNELKTNLEEQIKLYQQKEESLTSMYNTKVDMINHITALNERGILMDAKTIEAVKSSNKNMEMPTNG